ncbi:hypothetical protein N7452_000203 [Penicillium brevicompactum]|uniref:AMP-dependent synthetase/ligase domain-containing protein n=1 Tax=Penicillium brevicompactum TaxID=5074 RepID=A0A9W9R316_PENBR|nr:hypothetical protein N7452_000203 [Penicillium brevicompactum]
MDPPGLPNDFMFQRLVNIANNHVKRDYITLIDYQADRYANHAKLLADVLELQSVLFRKLSRGSRKALNSAEYVVILLSAPAGYEWLVSFLTILSLGAVVSPISTEIKGAEMAELSKETNAAAIVLGSLSPLNANKLASSLECPVIAVNEWLLAQPSTPPKQFQANPKHVLDEESAGYLLFTSGSTSRPKGVLHSRNTFTTVLSGLLSTGILSEQDTMVYTFASNLASGIVYCLYTLLAGAKIEFSAGVWSPEWMWERIREGRATVVVDQPSRYKEMADFYWNELSFRSEQEKNAYLNGLRHFRWPAVSGSQPTEAFRAGWNSIPGVTHLINSYGMTEVSGITGLPPTGEDPFDKCTGYLLPGVEANLEDGELGELLVRTPNMFMGYFNRPDLTKMAFDENGFFRTGDFFERRGAKYYLHGRVSVDVINIQGRLVFAADVEAQILSLPYVQDVYVVPISQMGTSEKMVAAIIRPSVGTASNFHVTVDQLRRDLKGLGLEEYQIPVAIQLTDPDRYLPMGTGGKKGKAQAIKKYFTGEWEPSLEREKA